MNVLLFNAGSSSLKSTLMRLETGETSASHTDDLLRAEAKDSVEDPSRAHSGGPEPSTQRSELYCQAVEQFLSKLVDGGTIRSLADIHAVGHRIVHGGAFRTAIRITPEIRTCIDELTELAPLHNPPSLATLVAAEERLPSVPHIATFDTAFHSTLLPQAYTYPVPSTWTTEWGIRRYGFHGLSHSYCANRSAELLARPLGGLKVVSCHLGHGCSVAAVDSGRCVDTTMGYTPLEGLMMGTRSGSVDPGILLHVQRKHGLTADELETALNRQSGLLGVSGVSGDMRQVLAAAEAGESAAQLALDIYVHRVRQAIGAMAASLGGLDVLAFTAGVGEHAATVRAAVCQRLEFLGLRVAPDLNAVTHSDAVISAPASRIAVLVVTCREDLSMLSEVRGILTTHEKGRLATTTPGEPKP